MKAMGIYSRNHPFHPAHHRNVLLEEEAEGGSTNVASRGERKLGGYVGLIAVLVASLVDEREKAIGVRETAMLVDCKDAASSIGEASHECAGTIEPEPASEVVAASEKFRTAAFSNVS